MPARNPGHPGAQEDLLDPASPTTSNLDSGENNFSTGTEAGNAAALYSYEQNQGTAAAQQAAQQSSTAPTNGTSATGETTNYGQVGNLTTTPGFNPYESNAGMNGVSTGGVNAFGAVSEGQTFAPGAQYQSAVLTGQQNATMYGNIAAQATTSAAPTINDPYAAAVRAQILQAQQGQGQLQRKLEDTATNGYNSKAYSQYAQGVRQAAQAQIAQANSAGNGAVGAAGARRMASEGNAQAAAGSIAGGQLVAQQAQQQASGQLGQLLGQKAQLAQGYYGQGQGLGLAQANLAQQQMAQNYSAQQGYGELGIGQQQQSLAALQGASGAMIGSEQIAQGKQLADWNQNMMYLGAGASGLSGIAGAGANMIPSGNQQSNSGGYNPSQGEGYGGTPDYYPETQSDGTPNQ